METVLHREMVGDYRITIYLDDDAECPLGWGDHVTKESAVYKQWADGDVYGYVIKKVTTCPCCKQEVVSDEDETLWGMYGLDYCISEAQQMAKEMIATDPQSGEE